MKTITFFSEKGGVGKSSFSMMYASWLHYKYGVKVGLADFNRRILAYRNEEIEQRNLLRKNNPDIKPFNVLKTWPIVDVNYERTRELRRSGVQQPYAVWLEEQCVDGRLTGMDVVLCDFPGSLSGYEFIQNISLHMLNLIVIPTDKDPMTLDSTFKLHDMIRKYNHCAFINKARTNLNNQRASYLKFAELLVKEGLPLLPDLISNSDRMMSIEKVDNIRSTFGFPDFDLPEYGASKDLGIGNLFIDVTRELAKTKDLRGTGTADLSFVERLRKVDDGRQLRGTQYKDYEI